MSVDEKGLWMSPLSAEQIQAALRFGEETYGTVEATRSEGADPYDVYVSEVLVLVTIGTAFNRMTAYAGQVKRTGAKIDLSVVESINFMEHFRTHFNVRTFSKHKKLSIMATDVGDGTPQYMELPEVERAANGSFSQTCLFPIPADRCEKKGFEIGVPRFVPLKLKTEFQTVQFMFDFALVH